MSFCNSSVGEGKQEGEVGQAEETKELLLRAFCVPSRRQLLSIAYLTSTQR